MTRRELIDHCLGFPGSYEDYPFDDPGAEDAWTAMRHSSNRRCFAFIYERGGLRVNLKCEPARADFLRGTYAGVKPAFHMNKEHWITVEIDSDVPQSELFDMIERSRRLTAPKR